MTLMAHSAVIDSDQLETKEELKASTANSGGHHFGNPYVGGHQVGNPYPGGN